MTGYLTNLAARTLGQLPLIRPRLASVFEPPAGAHFFAGASSVASPSTQETLAPRTEDYRTTGQQPPFHPTADEFAPAAEVSAGELTTPVATSQIPRRALDPHTTVMSDSDLRFERAIDPRSGRISVGEPVHSPGLIPVDADRLPAEIKSPSAGGLNKFTSVETTLRADKVAPLDDENERPTPVRTVIPAVQVEAARPSVVARPSVITRHQPVAPTEPHEIEGGSQPAIRITIGRVEVRAIMASAPAAAPRERQRTTGVSLGDYLKPRKGAE